jgi:RND family efflux transporter MFP subunit
MFKIIKKKWYVFVLIFIVAALYLNSQRPSTASSKESTPYTVQKQTMTDMLSLSGKIDAAEHATLQFQSAGKLAWVGVKEGDYVKKYQAIASLDKRDLQNRMQKYLNLYMTSRWNFDQAQDNNENNGGLSVEAQEALKRTAEKSQFDLNNSVLDVELQNLALQYATITSPIEGVVVHVDSPYAGVNIIPAQATFEIINPKTLFFSATADQTDVVKVQEDMRGDVVLDAFPDEKITGQVKSISFTPKTDESGTVYEVKVAIDTVNNANYRLGMTGDINFDLSKRTAIAVPSKYIVTEGDKKYVLKKKDSQKVKQYIEIGESDGDITEITSGLSEGDVIYD